MLDLVVVVSGTFFAILGIAMIVGGRLGAAFGIISATIIGRECYGEIRAAAPHIVASALNAVVWFSDKHGLIAALPQRWECARAESRAALLAAASAPPRTDR
jgi:hypothetical protein